MKEYRECAVYAGSFDPITLGHLDLIRRAAKIFPRLIVAVAENIEKVPCFSIPQRLKMIREAVSSLPGVEAESFSGLLIDYAARKQVRVVIRGLRAVSDFEYEFQMALMNRKLDRDIQTVFLMTGLRWIFTSSSIIKEAAQFGGDIDDMVPPEVNRRLKEKLGKKK